MSKRTIDDLKGLKGKRVLIRVDFNVPLDAAGNVSNDRRIRAAVPTIKTVIDAGGKAILVSHLGRPKGDPAKDAIFRMDNVAKVLADLLGKPVKKVDQVIGDQVTAAVRELQPGEVLLLENVRFHPGEQKRDEKLARELVALADVYVNDAFGTCHREDVSMCATPAAMKDRPRVVGKLVAKELRILDQLLSAPPRPLLGLLGGGKVSDKIGFIKALLERVDRVLIGGAMSYTFMKAQGQGVGNSRLEADKLNLARELLSLGKGEIALPVDHLCVQSLESSDPPQTRDAIPDGWIAVDIGPKTIAAYREEIAKAGTVVWNGPMGKFEDAPFSKGTRAVAEAMAQSKAVTIVGGGETAEAVEQFGLDEKMTHVSTGGGAFLEYVEGTPFKPLEQIEDK